MVRHKEFNEDEVLDRALALFRSKGYRETSFSAMVEELGVSRQSLYDTYGDKQALYLAALRRYLARAREWVKSQMEADIPVRDAFGRLFEDLIESTCCSKVGGCAMVNAMVETSQEEPAVKALAIEHARVLEGMFATRLSAAQRAGELGRDKDPIALARFFYHTTLGLAVSARALGDKEPLRATAGVALGLLD